MVLLSYVSSFITMKIIRYFLPALLLLFLLLVLPGQFTREYTVNREITLHQPPEIVFNVMMNPFTFHNWMPGYKAIQPVSGELGASGSINRIMLERNGNEMDMLQHLESVNRPEILAAIYELKRMQMATHIELVPVYDGTRMIVALHLSAQGWWGKVVLFWTHRRMEKELTGVLESLQHFINGKESG